MTAQLFFLRFFRAWDWRSALLAAGFALPWLALLGSGWFKGRRVGIAAAAALAGAVLFPLSIAWVQVPIQGVLNSLWGSLLSVAEQRRYLLIVGLPSLIVASVVQESAKLLLAAGALRLLGGERKPRVGLALGAAAGAGYGGFEAFWIFNTILASGWTWATVQLAGVPALLGFVERFFTVPFHIGTAALIGYGCATGRPWRFWLLAITLHTLLNYCSLLIPAGLLDAIGTEVWCGAVAAVTLGAALAARRQVLQAWGQ